MTERCTSRNGRKIDFDGEHLNLKQLREIEIAYKKQLGEKEKNNEYLLKEIPPYPQPEFRVSILKHDTNREALEGICEDLGFRGSGTESLMWFSLAVGPEEIRSAEEQLLKETFQELPNEELGGRSLWKFATSLAFSETSAYGSFRLKVPLQEVLDAYSEQFCSGDPPVMRVYRTSVFNQEVQYTVLVHSPRHEEKFHNYPLLAEQPEGPVCQYRDGQIVWRSQAMCETHRYEMVEDKTRKEIQAVEVQGPKQFYVWDQVAVALHLKEGEVLKLRSDQLRPTYCQMFQAPYMEYRKKNFVDFEKAEALVEKLFPSFPLKKETSLKEHFEAAVAVEEAPE